METIHTLGRWMFLPIVYASFMSSFLFSMGCNNGLIVPPLYNTNLGLINKNKKSILFVTPLFLAIRGNATDIIGYSVFVSIYYIWQRWKSMQIFSLGKKNIIPIVPELRYSSWKSIFINDYILRGNTVQDNFIRSYNEINKDKDIHIIIQTFGGDDDAFYKIIDTIMSHKHKGKFICYVPEFCYSGGILVALACDKIVTTRNAIFKPCDGIIFYNEIGCSVSVPYIMRCLRTNELPSRLAYGEEISGKLMKELMESVKKDIDYLNMIEMNDLNFFNEICSRKKLNVDQKQLLHQKLFSGEVVHNHPYSADEMKQIVPFLEIVEDLPDFSVGFNGR